MENFGKIDNFYIELGNWVHSCTAMQSTSGSTVLGRCRFRLGQKVPEPCSGGPGQQSVDPCC